MILMGESKQVREGMLLSCLRRWAGQEMKPAMERKSQQLTALHYYAKIP